MKFGDAVVNTAASENNPIKYAIFVREQKRYIQVTDGKGNFWQADKAVIKPVETKE